MPSALACNSVTALFLVRSRALVRWHFHCHSLSPARGLFSPSLCLPRSLVVTTNRLEEGAREINEKSRTMTEPQEINDIAPSETKSTTQQSSTSSYDSMAKEDVRDSGEVQMSGALHECSAHCHMRMRPSGVRTNSLEAKRQRDHVERIQNGWGMGVAHDSSEGERIQDKLARVRAAEYLNTTAEQYTRVASDLLILRQERQAKHRFGAQARNRVCQSPPFASRNARALVEEEQHLQS